MADLCKHHELILQYAEDCQKYAEPWKLWQVESWGGAWVTLGAHPQWSSCRKYRRKPRTIRIGEYDVPEPIRVEPEDDAIVWRTSLVEDRFVWKSPYDRRSSVMVNLFQRGLLHETPEAAELHGRALASLTSDA